MTLLDAVQAKLTDDVLRQVWKSQGRARNSVLDATKTWDETVGDYLHHARDARSAEIAGYAAMREAILSALSPLLLDAEAQRQRVEQADWKVPFRQMMDIVCRCGDEFDSIEAFIEHVHMVHDDEPEDAQPVPSPAVPSPDYQPDGWSKSAMDAMVFEQKSPRGIIMDGLEAVPISRTVTVEIGEPEP